MWQHLKASSSHTRVTQLGFTQKLFKMEVTSAIRSLLSYTNHNSQVTRSCRKHLPQIFEVNTFSQWKLLRGEIKGVCTTLIAPATNFDSFNPFNHISTIWKQCKFCSGFILLPDLSTESTQFATLFISFSKTCLAAAVLEGLWNNMPSFVIQNHFFLLVEG